MEVHLGSAGDPSGIEADVMSVAQRFGVDYLDDVPNGTRKGEVDRLPFDRRTEVGETDHPSGDADRFDRPAGGRKFDLLVREGGGPADPSHRRQPTEVADRQVAVSHRSISRDDLRRARA